MSYLILSSYLRECFGSGAMTDLAKFASKNIDKVLRSYPYFDWKSALPKDGVFRIDNIQPDKLFERMGDDDPEYSFNIIGNQFLLVVGENDNTDLPIEIEVLKEGGGLRTCGHTHPGSQEYILPPSMGDFVALIVDNNPSEFILNRNELFLYHQPDPDFIAQIPAEYKRNPKELVESLFSYYIREEKSLDEATFNQNPNKYYRDFCVDVFRGQIFDKQNMDVILQVITSCVEDASKPKTIEFKPISNKGPRFPDH